MPSAVWWWSQKFLTRAGQKPVPWLWTSKTMKQINIFPDNMPSLRCFVIATENGWLHQISLIVWKALLTTGLCNPDPKWVPVWHLSWHLLSSSDWNQFSLGRDRMDWTAEAVPFDWLTAAPCCSLAHSSAPNPCCRLEAGAEISIRNKLNASGWKTLQTVWYFGAQCWKPNLGALLLSFLHGPTKVFTCVSVP